MELHFIAATLHVVREAVAVRAARAGMAQERVSEVALAVHELAANAVRHGAGWGRLRMDVTGGALRCEVSDAGRAARDGHEGRGTGNRQQPRASGGAPWPVERGHGLWIVRRVCDEMSMVSGPGGSRVTAVFSVSAGSGRALSTRTSPCRPCSAPPSSAAERSNGSA